MLHVILHLTSSHSTQSSQNLVAATFDPQQRFQYIQSEYVFVFCCRHSNQSIESADAVTDLVTRQPDHLSQDLSLGLLGLLGFTTISALHVSRIVQTTSIQTIVQMNPSVILQILGLSGLLGSTKQRSQTLVEILITEIHSTMQHRSHYYRHCSHRQTSILQTKPSKKNRTPDQHRNRPHPPTTHPVP